MITLKAVLVGSSCAGVLAIGGVTYATVGNSHATHPSHPKAPAAKPALAAPDHARPACLPKAGDVRHAVPQHAPGVPEAANAAAAQHAAAQAGRQAQSQVQQAQQQMQQGGSAPAAGLPKADGAQVPAAKAPAGKVPAAKMPAGGVPGGSGASCVPSVPGKAPKPSLPAKPALPKLPHVPTRVSCDSIKPAVALGGSVERSVILARGLGHGTKHVRVITYKAHKLCMVTEKWVGHAGQWLQVERVQAPKSYGLDQLRDALQLPAGGAPVNVAGQRGWTTPLGGAVLWYSEDGFAMCLTGSPAYATQLQAVAAQLQQQAQQAQQG